MTSRRSRLQWWGSGVLGMALILGAGGCGGNPAVRPVYQDAVTSIRLYTDARGESPYRHPVEVAPETMQAILQGVRAVSRKGILGALITGQAEERPAFSKVEVNELAPLLSRALEQAGPDEIVTFYRRISDASVGLAITSGGVFVHGPHLYFILANNRTLPADGLNQNMVAEIDPVDTPLLPITRAGFRAAFTPSLAIVPPDERARWPYVDPGRVLAIDLRQMDRELRHSGVERSQ